MPSDDPIVGKITYRDDYERMLKEEMEKIKDNIQELQNLGANKHAKAFKLEIDDLEQEMNNMMEIIEIWVEVQKKWIYLEAIFVGSEDMESEIRENADKSEEKINFRLMAVPQRTAISLFVYLLYYIYILQSIQIFAILV